jgi:hypothetical protein
MQCLSDPVICRIACGVIICSEDSTLCVLPRRSSLSQVPSVCNARCLRVLLRIRRRDLLRAYVVRSALGDNLGAGDPPVARDSVRGVLAGCQYLRSRTGTLLGRPDQRRVRASASGHPVRPRGAAVLDRLTAAGKPHTGQQQGIARAELGRLNAESAENPVELAIGHPLTH